MDTATKDLQMPPSITIVLHYRLEDGAGRRKVRQAERNYSPTEGESLACMEGLRDTKYYTLGCKDLYIATDHKPLC